jgi:hypothetical protein
MTDSVSFPTDDPAVDDPAVDRPAVDRPPVDRLSCGRRRLLGGGAGLALAAALPGRPARAAPDAELWPRWQAHDAASTATVDHGAWAGFLDRFRRPGPQGVARVAYAAVDGAASADLRGYLDRLAATPVSSLDRAEQFAFWVNLYNALTVRVVLDHWPVETIRDIDISPGLFANGPWGAELVTVEATGLSLDDIEHRILRPIWREPRIHYAVNCAAVGCPDLAAEPFTAANTERLLAVGARAYVGDPRGVRVAGGDRLVVSSIYRWFAEDFGTGWPAGVLDHLRRWAPPETAALLAGRSRIDDHAYDWSINAAPPGAG